MPGLVTSPVGDSTRGVDNELPSHAYQPSQEDLGEFEPTEYANIPDYDDI